jgi:hypothetical protein
MTTQIATEVSLMIVTRVQSQRGKTQPTIAKSEENRGGTKASKNQKWPQGKKYHRFIVAFVIIRVKYYLFC